MVLCTLLRFVLVPSLSLRICPGVLWTVNDEYKKAESRDLKCGPKEWERGQMVFFANSKQTLGVGGMETQERPSATRSEAVMTGGISQTST